MENKNAGAISSIRYESPVINFYSGKTVFMTGCTGFLGTVLLEKLLFICGYNIKNIYVLMKPNDDQTIYERLSRLYNSEAFQRIRETNPNYMQKIIPIGGDLSKKSIGLTEKDLFTLRKEVSVVFHCAADTSFEMSLKQAVNVNTKATEELLKICKDMQQLIAFIYVSTAYSNCNSFVIDEKVYPAEVPVETVYKLLEYSKDDLFQYLLNGRPNPYTYSKALSEDLIQSYADTLPSVIVRPSIITSSVKEPTPGWLRGWNGLNGIVYSGIRGYLRCWKGDPSYIVDATPVDYVANILIVAAWEANVRRLKSDKKLKVYNFCSGLQNPISTGSMISTCMDHNDKLEMDKSKANKTFIFTTNFYLYSILFFFLHILPALALDVYHLISGKQIIMFQNLKKINKLKILLKHFYQNQFLFVDHNVRNLHLSLDKKDKLLFDFDVRNIRWNEYLKDYVSGMKKLSLDNKQKQQ